MDNWLPRLYLGAQVILMVVCGVLVALDENSLANDLFLAAGGGLIFTHGYQLVTKPKA